jgi:hypothetical protein
VTELEDILAQMRKNPKGIRFNDLCRVCNFYFGKAKTYQIKQVLRAIEKLEVNYGTEK